MKKMFGIVLVALVGSVALAVPIKNLIKDFTAPAVVDSAELVDVSLGQIVYNRASGTFQGLDVNSGNWANLSQIAGLSSVISTGSGERIERLRFGNPTETSVCDTSPCTIYNQSGGVYQVTRSGTGLYTLTFNTPFDSPPSCSFTSISGTDTSLTNVTAESNTTITWQNVNRAGFFYDVASAVICVGKN